ncbi:hypothetical protein [Kitasatospora sp. GP82]|uniref:hypothetical protein n=1 Tax=Kitasatospora sp. GP82 TaxID=3035089 RepID=UPI002475DC4E|nr:hypothetical protein [Kitasatospora sp. GP82]MDH6130011.1 FtsH-binding integral membrane protein [Kitasatospora sp. GP82]
MTQTTHPGFRTLRDQIRNGAKGALIGTLFGLMWYVFGLAAVHGTQERMALIAGATALVLAAAAVISLFLLSGRIPPRVKGRTVVPGSGPKFITIVIIEAVVLGVGNNVLRTSLHRPELMYTWSALVVGAHFFPMARKLSAPMLRVIGAAMLAVAALTALAAQLHGATTDVWQAVPGLGCAAILWASVLFTAVRAHRFSKKSGSK